MCLFKICVITVIIAQTCAGYVNGQDPCPTTVSVTASPDHTIFSGSTLTLTCIIHFNESVDIPVTVNTAWSGPSDGIQFTAYTSVATRITATIYTSTATIGTVKTSDSGEHTCTATVSSPSSDCKPVTGLLGVTILLPAPTNLTTTSVQSTSITINWTQPEEEPLGGAHVESYDIAYIYQGPCPSVIHSGSVSINGGRRQYTVQDLHEFSNYTFTIVASNDAGSSPSTSTTGETLSDAPSGPPQNIRAVSTSPFSITIQWDDVTCIDRNGLITGYSVRYGGRTVNVTVANNRTFTANGLIPRTSYTIQVAAVNEGGTGLFQSIAMETNLSNDVGLHFYGVSYKNNSIVTLDMIGENDHTALYCLTNKTECCRSSDTPAGVGHIGEWFYPDGSSIRNAISGDDIYRGRGASFVRLQRRSSAQVTGVFRCEVPDASGTNQQLYVGAYTVNSGSPSITDLSYNRSTLTLTCTSTGGPATNVTWRKNGMIIKVDGISIYHRSQRVVDTTLATYENTLSSDGANNFVGTFTCTVDNSRGTSTRSIILYGVVIHGADQPLAIGETATISCISDAPATSIDWLDSERQVVASETSMDQLNLSFNPVNDSIHDSVYTCRVNRSDEIVEESLKIAVLVPSNPIMVTITSSGSTTAGQEYTLVCNASAIPGLTNTPAVTWFHTPDNDSLCITSNRVAINPENTWPSSSTLIFSVLTNSYAGEYTCVGNVQSPALNNTWTIIKTINVIVQEPDIKAAAVVSDKNLIVVGDAHSLLCNVTGYGRLSVSITYQWFKDNEAVSGEIELTLAFNPLSFSDAGQYRCDATVSSNQLCQSISTMSNTKVLSLTIPSPTVTLTASPDGNTNTRSPSLILTCTIGLSMNKVLDILVTVNTIWSGPSGIQLTSIATRENDTTYTSTATYSSAVSSNTGEYTCRVTVSSTHPFVGNSDEVIGSKKVKDVLQRFQLKLRRTDDCISWSANQAKEIRSYIFDELLQAINARCQCELPKENLLNGVFSCLDSRDQTTYRSTIIGTQSITATQLERYLEDWVTSDPTLTIQWYTVKLDTNCPVSIPSLGEPECESSQRNKTSILNI